MWKSQELNQFMFCVGPYLSWNDIICLRSVNKAWNQAILHGKLHLSVLIHIKTVDQLTGVKRILELFKEKCENPNFVYTDIRSIGLERTKSTKSTPFLKLLGIRDFDNHRLGEMDVIRCVKRADGTLCLIEDSYSCKDDEYIKRRAIYKFRAFGYPIHIYDGSKLRNEPNQKDCIKLSNGTDIHRDTQLIVYMSPEHPMPITKRRRSHEQQICPYRTNLQALNEISPGTHICGSKKKTRNTSCQPCVNTFLSKHACDCMDCRTVKKCRHGDEDLYRNISVLENVKIMKSEERIKALKREYADAFWKDKILELAPSASDRIRVMDIRYAYDEYIDNLFHQDKNAIQARFLHEEFNEFIKENGVQIILQDRYSRCTNITLRRD